MPLQNPDSPAGLSIRDLLVVAAVYTISFLIVAGFPHPRMGFPLDDSWIHQVVARNLARDGTLGFIPGVHSSGSTSLLWSVLLAANLKFFSAINPVVYSAILNAFLLIACGWGLLAMARKDGLSPSACWIWALTPALDGNFVWLGIIGMEHVLFVALSVVGVYLWFQGSLRSAIWCSLCVGALCLTRPEGLVLAVLLLLPSRYVRRSSRDIAILAVTVTTSILISLTANFITSHSWLPTTYEGRKWLYFGTDNIPLFTRLSFPYILAKNLLQPWALRQSHPLYIVTAIVILLMAAGMWKLISEHRLRSGFLAYWSFILIGIYSVMLPTRSHGGRYQPLFLALSFPLMFLGLQVLIRRATWSLNKPQFRAAAQTAVILAACILCGIFSLRAWRTITSAGIGLIEATHAKMGHLLIDTLPPQSKVASFDIGRVGYIDTGNILDMGGLTDSSFLPYMREHRILDYLEQQKIQYLMWPTEEDNTSAIPWILALTPSGTRNMTEIARICAPHNLWALSFPFTMDAAPCQTLYHLQFSKAGEETSHGAMPRTKTAQKLEQLEQ